MIGLAVVFESILHDLLTVNSAYKYNYCFEPSKYLAIYFGRFVYLICATNEYLFTYDKKSYFEKQKLTITIYNALFSVHFFQSSHFSLYFSSLIF